MVFVILVAFSIVVHSCVCVVTCIRRFCLQCHFIVMCSLCIVCVIFFRVSFSYLCFYSVCVLSSSFHVSSVVSMRPLFLLFLAVCVVSIFVSS